MVNKSASKLGTLLFTNGNRNEIYIGTNRNTGATIVWQVRTSPRFKPGFTDETRLTGRHIAKLWAELSDALNKGECEYVERNVTLCVAMPEIPRGKGDNVADRIAYLTNKGLINRK